MRLMHEGVGIDPSMSPWGRKRDFTYGSANGRSSLDTGPRSIRCVVEPPTEARHTDGLPQYTRDLSSLTTVRSLDTVSQGPTKMDLVERILALSEDMSEKHRAGAERRVGISA